MKKLFAIGFALVAALLAVTASAARHQFETVPGDPMATQIYTLPNGLKVFMTVNKDKPRIQTYIAVRVGGKNDPAETTGLAHYFEHLMFKGTETFGTQNYAAEKPLLDQIEQLFEVYRVTADSTARHELYRQIDSISYQASLIAIPNEYDKLMAAIGAEGTNAYTSQDVTCYVENIPSNQIENWARIQADRFMHPVLRGFHTELETIYEEKNMSLTRDNRKMGEAMLTALFPSHPYGTQTVLGTQENLKNPSITNVKNYHKQWYVPNNMAICLSGDFDPDEMVDVIERYFGAMQPNPSLPVLKVAAEAPITTPKTVEVLGPESERLYLAWRVPGATDPDKYIFEVLGEVLSNGKSGLIDVNINNAQKALGAGAGTYGLADQDAFLLIGMPNPGQSLDQLRELLLEQVQLLRDGHFDDSLIAAIKNNINLSRQQALEDNGARASVYVDAFVNGQSWPEFVAEYHALDNVTKDDVVRVARKYLGDTNYAAIYKRQGEDTTVVKMPKPELTPIATNRDKTSAFLRQIQGSEVEPIEPVFLDFGKDVTILKAKHNTPVYYTRNVTNDISTLIYVYELGTFNDKLLTLNDYFDLIGTDKQSYDQIQAELYRLACSIHLSIGTERSYVVISGLSENLPRAAAIYEDWLANAKPDAEVYARFVDQTIQDRQNAKANQQQNFARLRAYATYGPDNSYTRLYKNDELAAIDPADIIDAIRRLVSHEQEVLYYGNLSEKEVLKLINNTHLPKAKPLPAPKSAGIKPLNPAETTVYIAPYDAKQLYMSMFTNMDEDFDLSLSPIIALYNEYFGGSMNAIVFQEMRESRSLAYSAWAFYNEPGKLDYPATYNSQIATQNDKMKDAIDAFVLIIEDMPQSPESFEIAKKALELRLRAQRVIKDDKAWAYLGAKRLGLDSEKRKAVYENLAGLTLADVVAFQQDKVKGHTYNYAILGDPADLDLEALAKTGKVVMLTTDEIFGY